MSKLNNLSRPVLESEEAQEMKKLYGNLVRSMMQYESEQFSKWCDRSSFVSEEKLRQPLLR